MSVGLEPSARWQDFERVHRRMSAATREAAMLREKVAQLEEELEYTRSRDVMPLTRRIANQRRELRWAWRRVDMYRSWWLAEKNKGSDEA